MKLTAIINNNYNNNNYQSSANYPYFGATMPTEDISIILGSVAHKVEADTKYWRYSGIGHLHQQFAHKRPVRTDITFNQMYADIYALLKLVKQYPASIIKLVEGNKTKYNIVNGDNANIIGSGPDPISALKDVFISTKQVDMAEQEQLVPKMSIDDFYNQRSNLSGISAQKVMEFAKTM